LCSISETDGDLEVSVLLHNTRQKKARAWEMGVKCHRKHESLSNAGEILDFSGSYCVGKDALMLLVAY